jgi:hypothetical protein
MPVVANTGAGMFDPKEVASSSMTYISQQYGHGARVEVS